MLFTVAICTRNRANSLKRTLSSLESARKPDCVWELLVVDNGSTDDTHAVVSEFAGRLPIKYEMEQRGGLSYARNRAVACAQGDYIIWTDDDVMVDEAWLTAYVDAFKRWPDVAVFGGKIVPTLVEPSVGWFVSVLPIIGPPLAARDLGPNPVAMSVEANVLPYGANFATRSAEQRKFSFDPRLGVAPGRRLLFEETQVIKAMLSSGLSGMWFPESRVNHMIGHERQSVEYIANYYEGHGATEVLLDGGLAGTPVFGVPSWLWRRYATRLAGYWLSRLFSPAQIWVPKLMKLAHDRGKIKYLLSARSAPTQGVMSTADGR
ncbi:MAG: glycosyltransferase family 2 protein [Alphaproteobacteria bacterium]|nr:glycosyltransferase family 2 protein [Alphaproteobacteria bacterium]